MERICKQATAQIVRPNKLLLHVIRIHESHPALHHLCPLTHYLRHSFHRPWYSFPFIYLRGSYYHTYVRRFAVLLHLVHWPPLQTSTIKNAHTHPWVLACASCYRFYISLNRTMISIRKSLSYHKLSFRFLTALMLSDQHSIKRMCEHSFAAVYGTKHTTQ